MNNIIDPYSHIKNKVHIKIDPEEIHRWLGIPNYEWANEDIVSKLEEKGWNAEINKEKWQEITGHDSSAELIFVQKLVAKTTEEVADEIRLEVISKKQGAVESLGEIRNSLEEIGCLTSSLKRLLDRAIEELNE